jgi:hypothetical protein
MRRREFITLLGGGNRGVAYVVDAPGEMRLDNQWRG